MVKKYSDSTINKALSLVNSGYTRKAAAKKVHMGLPALNYYISKTASPKLRKILLRPIHIKAIRALNQLL